MSDVVQFFEMEMSTYTGMNYEMGVTILRETVKKNHVQVTLNAIMKVKVSEQCRIAASNGNQVIVMIRRNIT